MPPGAASSHLTLLSPDDDHDDDHGDDHGDHDHEHDDDHCDGDESDVFSVMMVMRTQETDI